MDMANELAIALGNGQRRLETDRERFRQDRDRAVNADRNKTEREVRSVQNSAKWLAVLLPPILPLLLGASCSPPAASRSAKAFRENACGENRRTTDWCSVLKLRCLILGNSDKLGGTGVSPVFVGRTGETPVPPNCKLPSV